MLAGLSASSMDAEERSTEISMEELAALVDTAGADTVAMVLQTRQSPDPRSFLGAGKLQEIKEIVTNNECDLVVIDNELSPSQARAIEEELGVRVVDRSGLILDIFAQRARTKEGRLQVQLAQYEYLLPRLTGMWTHLKRQAGTSAPIGTRGPGETQLETDRRHIRRIIQNLQADLEQVRRVRSTQRRRREKNAMPMVALVGYTNAGKSTVLNRLTRSDIPANDRLFDTLDTTTRRLWLPELQREILLSDTVGFIAKLPHHLVEAFRATLEELEYADLLIHVIDSADPERDDHIAVVDRLIAELAAPGTPVLECYNKCDLVADDEIPRGQDKVAISAASGFGLDALKEAVEQLLGRGKHHVKLLLPYAVGGMVAALHDTAQVLSSSYTENGIELDAIVDETLFGRLRQYVTEEV